MTSRFMSSFAIFTAANFASHASLLITFLLAVGGIISCCAVLRVAVLSAINSNSLLHYAAHGLTKFRVWVDGGLVRTSR